MTLRHARIFLSVYQTGHVTKAAQQLHMTQPAVTRAIQEIESYYGIRLFERMNRRLYVTEAGNRFYAYALHLVDSFDQMEKELRDWDKLGVLRVGTSITIGNHLLPEVLVRFQKDYPQLRIQTTVSNAALLQQALMDNELDFAVIEGCADGEEFARRAIAPDRLVLILPPGDLRAKQQCLELKDLAQDSFLLRDQGSVGRAYLEQVFALHGLPLVPVMESVSTQAIIRGVHLGLGISFLPERLVKRAIEEGQVATTELADENFVRENYIVWHKHKFLTASAKALMDCFCNLSWEIYGQRAATPESRAD